ncbi:hypothetical protein [Palleniella intestinalis]|nr:hypothetical protein [Palleniella intestinalis]
MAKLQTGKVIVSKRINEEQPCCTFQHKADINKTGWDGDVSSMFR